ncbi:MAG: hypothetical protein ABI579_09945, partial [Candidatus Sumerlaeota bacterium]
MSASNYAAAISYKDSGVDINEGDRFVADLKKINPSIGGFGGFLSIPAGYKNPKLVLSPLDGLIVLDEA